MQSAVLVELARETMLSRDMCSLLAVPSRPGRAERGPSTICKSSIDSTDELRDAAGGATNLGRGTSSVAGTFISSGTGGNPESIPPRVQNYPVKGRSPVH